MKYYLFIDETGDHGLANIDENFPIFLIAGILVSEKSYENICKEVSDFKKHFFGTDNVILRSNNIRKIDPPFQILFNLDIKREFYNKLNEIVSSSDYSILPAAILKKEYVKKYGKIARDPYEISMSFVLERLIFDCDKLNKCNEVEIIIEKRGKKEDIKLHSALQRIMTTGTFYVSDIRFSKLITNIDFKNKKENDAGLQLSDLVAYPIAKYVLDNTYPNEVFGLIKNKIRKNGNIKIFP